MLRDFDLDGVLDLVLGTHRMSSVPDPKLGLPHAIEGKPGAAILFLRGVRADTHAAGAEIAQAPPSVSNLVSVGWDPRGSRVLARGHEDV